MSTHLSLQLSFNSALLKLKGFNNYDFTNLENSVKFRDEGNQKFKEEKYFAAIALYNKALICGRKDKVHSSLCYANRSAAYLMLEYFKHCLHNIDLAEEGYPSEKIQKLHDRRQKCFKMMENSVDKAMEAFAHTFKMSYEPNPKLPFFIDSLKLKEDSRIGKHLVSTRDLKAGDVIAMIDPWRNPVNSLIENYIQGCYTCHDVNNGDLIPGDCKALFCSERCKLEHKHENSNHEEFNDFENCFPNKVAWSSFVKFFLHMQDVFGSVNEMKKFVDEHHDKQYTVFDFDWSDPTDPMYYKNMLLTMLNGRKPIDDGRTEPFRETLQKMCSFLKPNARLARFLNDYDKENDKFLDKIFYAIVYRNEIPLLAGNVIPFRIAHFFHPAMYLLVPIMATPVIIKQQNDKGWCFQCSSNSEALVSCKKDWSSNENEIMKNHSKKNFTDFFIRNDPKNLTNWLEYLKICYEFINENFHISNKNPVMKSVTDSKILEIYMILIYIGNPFAPLNHYLNLDKIREPTAFKKHLKSIEIEL